MKAGYVRLFTDDLGESHFQDLESELLLVEFAPEAPPVFLSSPLASNKISFFGAATGWRSDWHTSSGRNLFCVISGAWEITANDGEVRRFAQGDVVLAEDTIGKGHASRVVSDQDSLALLVSLV